MILKIKSLFLSLKTELRILINSIAWKIGPI